MTLAYANTRTAVPASSVSAWNFQCHPSATVSAHLVLTHWSETVRESLSAYTSIIVNMFIVPSQVCLSEKSAKVLFAFLLAHAT